MSTVFKVFSVYLFCSAAVPGHTHISGALQSGQAQNHQQYKMFTLQYSVLRKRGEAWHYYQICRSQWPVVQTGSEIPDHAHNFIIRRCCIYFLRGKQLLFY